MKKAIVTFEVDLEDFLPKKLKDHDFPIGVWASQTIFDLFFQKLLLDNLDEGQDIITGEVQETVPGLNEAMRKIYQQARETMRVTIQ